MVALNQRAILVSLPTLTHVFQTQLTTIQWTILAYDLTIIGLVLTLGRLGDLFGRKRTYVGGFFLFICGSALCGLAQSPAQLIIFRVIQGIGGAMITANGRAIVSVVVPTEERGKALGLTSTAFHVGYLMGPTLGGLLIDTIGWRWIFFLNIPVGLAGGYLAWKILEEKMERRRGVKIDFLGASLLLLTNMAFLYGMNQFSQLGLRDPVVQSLAVFSAMALCLFIWTELRAETPILHLSLFRNRLFSFSNLSLFVVTSTQSAIQFLIPFYLQSIMGFTPFQMGWIVITNSVVIVMIAPIAGWLSDRFGSRLLCTVGACSLVAGQFFIASLGLDSTVIRILYPLVLVGLGWAIFNSPNQSAILGSVPHGMLGAASGMTVTTARIGGATGVALSTAIFTYGLTAAGLSQLQIGSPETWGSSPEIFINAFSHTIHIVNFFALLAIIFSAMRGEQKS
jgi:EmrB/QacA subfamily drug resistance transporter